ncbi:J domain-containing protein [Pantanalinema sp. GBBB05]|uniref:J domain-containing protein n=1 Tax=Pantanalinema sp. GBBB05 TaxID=2604139 RepID=UPI001DC4C05B|nr:DnaJ domain-containing protein [Pantanalinema sp. GBBB05]
MSFQIERGLFLLDFIDHHAILGIPVDAEIKDIRKRYLKIARRLHPDSCASESETDKQRASELLSKLVNPAWEKLSQEKDRSEYILLLKLKGQQGLRQQSSGEMSNLAKQLSTASNPDHFYHTSLKSLADQQYDHLDQTLELTAQISELNLVFLMRKEGAGEAIANSTKQPLYTGSNIPDSSQSIAKPGGTAAPPPPRRESIAEQYYRRAEGHVAKNNFAQAILELRDALQIEPKNSRCHALMGMVYLKQNQPKMAKIYFDKALEHDPDTEMAQIGKQQLEGAAASSKAAGAKAGTQKTPPKADPKASKPGTKPNNDKPSGGLFGLFGGKKK